MVQQVTLKFDYENMIITMLLKGANKMKKTIMIALTVIMLGAALTGCTEADRVSSNISNEADNFNVVRRLIVMDDFTNTIQFEMTGYLSIHEDIEESQLEVTCKEINSEGKEIYKKHFVGKSQFTSYILEDTTGTDVAVDKYTLNFNPDMLVPFDVKNYSEDH